MFGSNGSSRRDFTARPVASQMNRNDVSHEEAMLVVCCLIALRASNDFRMFCETAEQEQQLASFSSQLAFQRLMLVSIVESMPGQIIAS